MTPLKAIDTAGVQDLGKRRKKVPKFEPEYVAREEFLREKPELRPPVPEIEAPEFPPEQKFIRLPSTKQLTREELEQVMEAERLEAAKPKLQPLTPEEQILANEIIGKIYADYEPITLQFIEEWATTDPEAFLTDLITHRGRTPDTELMLELFGATPELIEEIFTPVQPPEPLKIPEGGYKFTQEVEGIERLFTISEDYLVKLEDTIIGKYDPERGGMVSWGTQQTVVPVDGIRKLITITPDNRAYDDKNKFLGTYNSVTQEIDKVKTIDKASEVWDALIFGSRQMWELGENFFLSALPNLVFQDTPAHQRAVYGDEFSDRADAISQSVRDKFRSAYAGNKAEFEEWVEKNPNLEPRLDYAEGATEHPELLTDPWYWGYEFANIAPFCAAVVVSSITAGALTGGNPLAMITGGASVVYPVETQAVMEALLANGANEQQAAKIAGPAGIIIASLESLGRLPLLRAISPQLMRLFRKETAGELGKLTARELFKKGIKTATATELSEVITEVLQEATQNAAVKIVNENQSIFENLDVIAAKTAVATAPLSLFGGGVSMRRVAPSETQGKTDVELEALGFVKESESDAWYQQLEVTRKGVKPLEPKPEVVTPEQYITKRTEGMTLEEVEKLRSDLAIEKPKQITLERQYGEGFVDKAIIQFDKRIAELRGEPLVPVTPEVAPTEFPVAGDTVSGLVVRKDIPNQASIESSLEEYEILPGIREVPTSETGEITQPKFYSVEQEETTRKLAEEIKASGEINPLIVVIYDKGDYILEGSHRLDALRLLGIKSFPAQVVIDRRLVPEKAPPVAEVKPPVKPEVIPPAEVKPAPEIEKVPPIEPEAVPVEETSQDKLIRLVKTAAPVREETEILKHEELAERSARAAGILSTGEGRAAFERSKSALVGELPKVDFAAPETQMSEEEVKDLFNSVRDSGLRYFEKLNTAEALGKVLSGQIPTRGEIKLLEDMFGPELAKTLLDKRTLSTKAWENFLDAMNLPRAVLASWDLSAPLRQGATLFWGQPKQSLAALEPMVKAFAKEKWTILTAETIAENKYFALGEKAGLYQAPFFGVSATLTQREEAFMSRFARVIPLVKRSERAYVTYLNKLRMDVFASYAAHWEGTGKTLKDYKKLAEAINVLTGRGNLGKLSSMAPILSSVFFSPRYQASRIQLPITFLTATPVVRKMMARNIVAFVSANLTMLSLFALAGADLENDPRSADFGKGKIDNTRLDFWAGFQQYSRAIVQMITAMRKVSTTGKLTEVERSEVLGRFIRGKFSPILGLVADILSGESFVGEPLSFEPKDIQTQVFNRLVPMFIQDLFDAINDMGLTGALLAMPGVLGVGVQTYGGGYWDEFLDQLGEPIPVDTLPYAVDEEKIYTTRNFYTDTLTRTRGMKLEDIDPKYGFPPLAKAVVETANLKKVYEERPNIALYKIEADEFELFHNQWLEFQKAKTDEEKDAVKEKYPDYFMGNFSQREFSLLKRYHKAEDKDAFLEAHPELTLKPRNEWLRNNPLENARLALWGQAKIYSMEAYDEFNKLIKELDIPDDAIPELTLPPKGSVENYFKYQETGTEIGFNSWEVQLLMAQDDDLRQFLERQPIETPARSLELKIQHRPLFEQYDLLETDEERAALKVANPEWVDDMRRIEAIENAASDEIIESWVKRGNAIDEFGAGSSEAMVWLLDNPEIHKWALEKEILTDDGSDWNEPVLRINARWREQDKAYDAIDGEDIEARQAYLTGNDDYRKDRRRREAFGDGFPEELIENFVDYWELPVIGYRQERYLIAHPELATAMGIDLPEKAPSEKLDVLLEKETLTPAEELQVDAYKLYVPDKLVGDYVQYYSLEKPKGVDLWYEDDWWMMEHKDFYKDVYLGIKGNQRKDFRTVPTREVYAKYLKYLTLPLGIAREKDRQDNLDLDAWLVLKFGYTSIVDRDVPEVVEELPEDEIERRAKELEEKLERLTK